MRRRHPIHVIDFAGRGFLPVIASAVPGSYSSFPVRFQRGLGRIGLSQRDIRTHIGRAQGLIAGDGVRNGSQVSRGIFAGAVVQIIATALFAKMPDDALPLAEAFFLAYPASGTLPQPAMKTTIDTADNRGRSCWSDAQDSSRLESWLQVFTSLGCICMLIKIPNPNSIVTIDVPP